MFRKLKLRQKNGFLIKNVYLHELLIRKHRGHPSRENRLCLKLFLLFCTYLNNDHLWKWNMIYQNALYGLCFVFIFSFLWLWWKFLLALKFFPWKPKIDNVICYNDNLPTYIREISYVYMENLFVDDEKYVSLKSWKYISVK